MPRDTSIKSVLIIGSGPIVIGQACEFDYADHNQLVPSVRKELRLFYQFESGNYDRPIHGWSYLFETFND
jgi:hypothetical protein